MGLAGNDLANGFEIVIIWPSAGSAGRQGHIEGLTKKEIERKTIVIICYGTCTLAKVSFKYSTVGTNREYTHEIQADGELKEKGLKHEHGEATNTFTS